MTLVDTWASTAAGAFALSENNLYTLEAFREYFDHLKPDGMIAITRWEFAKPREALRVVSQAMEALHQLGVKDTTAELHRCERWCVERRWPPGARAGEEVAFHSRRAEGRAEPHPGHDSNDAHLNLHVLYMPMTADMPGMAHPAFARADSRSEDPRAFSSDYAYNVAPVDRQCTVLLLHSKARTGVQWLDQGGIDWKVNLGVAMLGVVLVVSIDAVASFLVLPLALSKRARSGSRHARAVLRRHRTWLHHWSRSLSFSVSFCFSAIPTYALTVVVFLMLLSSGIGSLLSRRWFNEPTRVISAVAFIVAMVLVYVFVLPHLLGALIGLPFALKLLVTAALLIPLGLAMGMPFPSGLRSLSKTGEGAQAKEGAVEWAWAMNAASSVLGSVLAMVIAIQFGLNVTLACGAAAYVVAVLLVKSLSHDPRLRQ